MAVACAVTFVPLSQMGWEAVEAGFQNGTQQLANNVIAQQIYDRNHDALEGLVGATALGTGAGGIVAFLSAVVAHAKGRRSSRPNQGEGRNGGSTEGSGRKSSTDPGSPGSGPATDPTRNPYRNPDGTLVLPENWPSPKNEVEAVALANFLKLVNDPAAADKAYNLIPDAYRGKVLGTDAARELFPEYGDREGKIAFTDLTTVPASIYANDRI